MIGRELVPAAVLVACVVSCAPATPGALVRAPSSQATPAVTPAEGAPPGGGGGSADGASALPTACGKPWNLDVVGGDGHVVVVCSHEVHREAIAESGGIGHALAPGLDPARERVCACAARLRPPPFVDLVFTAAPEEGRVTVRASTDDDLDPDLGPAFVACVGSVVARFPPSPSDACPGPGKVELIYPVRLELAP